MSTHASSPQELLENLKSAMPDERWRMILQTLAIKGIADTRQLQDATNFGRDKVMRILDRLAGMSLEGFPILSKLLKTIERSGEANRPPAIYILEEGGARFLRFIGFSEAKAFSLQDEIAIAHVLSMVSIHILANRLKIAITTDQTISYGDGKVLRPDHQVQLPDGTDFLIELEQTATMALVERIKTSLLHHQAFFASEESRDYLKQVRMLLNVKPGREFHRTLTVWQAAMVQVENELGKKLDFKIFALPMHSFLDSPEWEAVLSGRWVEADSAKMANSPVAEQTAEMPSALRIAERGFDSQITDVVLLRALAERFRLYAPQQLTQPNWEMFDVVRAIYEAQFEGSGSKVDREAALPLISISLLQDLMVEHPKMQRALSQALHYNRGRVIWSQQNILHRMGIVVRRFLSLYGWRSGRVLKVYPITMEDKSMPYSVKCELMPNLPDMSISKRISNETALSWVLWALFEYGQDIGIGRPEFW